MSSNIVQKNLFFSSLIIAFTALTGGLFYWLRGRRHYVKMAKVARLVIYPVKSLAGIEVDELEVTKTGVKSGVFRDRSWLLVTDENRFLTRRVEPSLALVKPSFHGDELWITAPDMPTLKVKLRLGIRADDVVIETKIWGTSTEGLYCGSEAEEWFSRYLNKPGTKLIENVPGLALRPNFAERNGQVTKLDKYKIVYQDATGLHLISQNSINDLNARLPDGFRVNHRNFRPNILVADCQPYEEDNWIHMAINGVKMTLMKPCERCVMTTVDPETGVKSEGEPLITLRKYRLAADSQRKLYGTAPLLGISIAPENEGLIRIDDDVLVVRK